MIVLLSFILFCSSQGLHKKMKFFIKNFFSKCYQIRRKFMMENLIFVQCTVPEYYSKGSELKRTLFEGAINLFFLPGQLNEYHKFIRNGLVKNFLSLHIGRVCSLEVGESYLWKGVMISLNSFNEIKTD